VSETSETTRPPRWATRLETMKHGRCGSTKMNEMLQGGGFVAKKVGRKILIDLNSFDDFITAQPSVGAF
jgi:hypothetical protein